MTEEEEQTSSGQNYKMTDSEYESARERYELGKASISELAAEFGVTRQNLSKRFKEDGVQRGSRMHEQNAAASAAAKAVVERFAEKRAELIEETRMQGLNALKQARMIGQKIVVDAMKASKPLGTVDDDLRALSRFNKVLVDNITTALTVLNANEHIDEEDLPVLTIEDLTDSDILEHHKSTGALDEDATLEDIDLEILQ